MDRALAELSQYAGVEHIYAIAKKEHFDQLSLVGIVPLDKENLDWMRGQIRKMVKKDLTGKQVKVAIESAQLTGTQDNKDDSECNNLPDIIDDVHICSSVEPIARR